MKILTIITTFILSLSVFAQTPENPANHIVKAMNVLSEQDLRCQSDNDCDSMAFGSKYLCCVLVS